MLSRMERRSNLPLQELDRIMDFSVFGVPTTSGVAVNAHAVRGLPAFFCAERILSETLASVPLNIIQRRNGQKNVASRHPLQPVLHSKPNPWQTSFEFRRMMQGHVVVRGNGYAEIIFDDNTGYPQYLIPRHPDKMIVVRLSDLKLGYGHYEPDGTIRPIPASNMFHVRNLSSDGIKGDSTITLFRNTFGAAIGREEHGARLFKNGVQVPFAIKHPQGLSDRAYKRLRESLEEVHGGVANSHKPMFLEEGMDVAKLGLTSQDSQFIESRTFDIYDMSRITNVPPHMLKAIEEQPRASVEQMAIEFKTYTMVPHYVNWEQRIDVDLLSSDDAGEYFSKFNLGGLERGDMKSRYESYAIGRQWGWLSANKILDLEDMNPIDEGGDEYLVPLNMVPAGEHDIAPTSKDSEPKAKASRALIELRMGRALTLRRRIQRAYQKVFKDAAGRLIRKETAALRKGIEKHLDGRSASGLSAYLDDFYQTHQAAIARSILPGLHSYAESIQGAAANEINDDTDMDVQMDHFVRQYSSAFAVRESGSRKAQLQKIIRDSSGADLEAQLSQRLDEWDERTPDKSSLRETIQAGAAIARLTWKLSGTVEGVKWIASDETCGLCTQLNGVTVGIDQNFLEDGDELRAQEPFKIRGSIAHPQLHEGCACMVAPLMKTSV